MEHVIRYHDEVWSIDDKKLGVAALIHHRPEDVDPVVKLYGAYLMVEDFSLGMSYFIPLEFIGDRDDETARVLVEKKQKEVMDNIWYRRPKFVANRTSRVEDLPRH